MAPGTPLPPPEVPTPLAPLVRVVRAANPGVMTGPGTNTYMIGDAEAGELAVVDPGPDDPTHLDSVAAAGEGRVRWVLVTHPHPDHAPGAAGLKARTGARVLGFGARRGFVPDACIGEGFVLQTARYRLQTVHTPGHTADHLCYLLDPGRILFSGDHLMNGSTVVIAPPEGDMAAYLDSLERVAALRPPLAAIAPGHGALIGEPRRKLDEVLDHRRERERAIARALQAAGRASVDELVRVVYVDVPPALHPIARYTVWAHLRKLAAEGRVEAIDPDELSATWTLPGS